MSGMWEGEGGDMCEVVCGRVRWWVVCGRVRVVSDMCKGGMWEGEVMRTN